MGFETLCTNVDDLCNSVVDNDDAVIPRIQEMLRDQPGLDQNCHSGGRYPIVIASYGDD